MHTVSQNSCGYNTLSSAWVPPHAQKPKTKPAVKSAADKFRHSSASTAHPNGPRKNITEISSGATSGTGFGGSGFGGSGFGGSGFDGKGLICACKIYEPFFVSYAIRGPTITSAAARNPALPIASNECSCKRNRF
jgi:hypothetical protein